jgi:hypothetical protein
MKIEIEIPRYLPRLVAVAVPIFILCAAAGAHGQTEAAATTDTLVGSALATLGNAVTMLRAEVAVLQTGERVARAAITATGVVTTQTGSWVTKVDHSSPGIYVVSFAPSVFTSAPTCVTSASANDQAAPSVECHDVTTKSMTCKATASGPPSGSVAPVDTAISLICAGS